MNARILVLGIFLGGGFTPAYSLAAGEDDSAEFFRFMANEAKVITVASVKPETVFNSVSNITVIDRATIERYDFASVSDALRIVPGVLVVNSFGIHNIVTFRGGLQPHYANKILVMLDNVPQYEANTGAATDVDRVGIDSIERIEVLRGPASVIYGSNALTGAVNIVLRKAEALGREGTVAGGIGSKYGKFQGDAQASRAEGVYLARGKDWSYHLSAAMRNQASPAYRFSDESNTVSDITEHYNARSFNFNGEYKRHALLLNLANTEQSFLGAGLTRATGLGFDEVDDLALASYGYTYAHDGKKLKYTAVYDKQRRHVPFSADQSALVVYDGYRVQNNLNYSADFAQDWDLELGGSHEYRKSLHVANYNRLTGMIVDEQGMAGWAVWEGSAFGQLGFTKDPWKAVVGSRYTFNGSFGSNISSRGSLIYAFDDRRSAKLVAGQAYRAPSLVENYLNISNIVLGNPSLQPERNRSVELSYLQSAGSFFGQVTGYYAEYLNNIYRAIGHFTRDGVNYSGANFYTNAGKITVKGLETELKYERPRTHAYVNVGYIVGSHGDSHAITTPAGPAQSYLFKYVPLYTIAEGVSQEIGPFFATASANHFAGMETVHTRLAEQYAAHVSLGCRIGAARHVFAVRNVTDRSVVFPEYVRERVVESIPLYTGRVFEYTFRYQF